MTAWVRGMREQGVLILTLGLVVLLFGSLSPTFISSATLAGIANRIPSLTLVALGMTGVMIVGGIDLSVGSVLALGGAVFGVLVVDAGMPIGGAALACVATGAAAGSLNGWVTERLRVPAFIVTLGSLEAARGLAYLLTGSQTKYLGGRLEWLAQPLPGSVITPGLVAALAGVALAHGILTRTVAGRWMIACGANEQATRMAGIRTARLKIAVYAACGVLAGMAALLQLARLGASDPNAGAGLELSAIAAAVIGGTSLAGGRGSMVSTFLGVLIMATLESGLVQVGASEPTKRVVTGVVIVAAVLVDTWRKRRRSGDA